MFVLTCPAFLESNSPAINLYTQQKPLRSTNNIVSRTHPRITFKSHAFQELYPQNISKDTHLNNKDLTLSKHQNQFWFFLKIVSFTASLITIELVTQRPTL